MSRLSYIQTHALNVVMVRQPLLDPGLLCKVPRSYSDAPHSVGFLWMRVQSVTETSS